MYYFWGGFLILLEGTLFAVFTAASIWFVGKSVSWFLGPEDWFCKAITSVSHISALIAFIVFEIHGFSHLIHI
jgi:hypothetical protein